MESLPVSELALFSAGAPLTDESAVSALSSSIIDVTVRVLGGVCYLNNIF